MLRDADDSEEKAGKETILKGVDSDLGTYPILGRKVMLQSQGPKRMLSLSTEKACKSTMRLAEARARTSVVLRDSFKAPSNPRMLKAQMVVVKELLIPPLGPKD